MRVSLGMRLQPGAWGGGNSFGYALNRNLQERGVEVSFDLRSPELDIVVLAEPDTRLKISAYGHRDVLKYLLLRNRNCIVVHRINNTSEARDDEEKVYNRFRVSANMVADYTVFISRWVHDRYVEAGYKSSCYRIILNGGDSNLWRRRETCARTGKLRLVTHHWSAHPNKGLDIYEKLDKMLEDSYWSQVISFTYIGKLPTGFKFKTSRYLEPLSGHELAQELRNHDIYLTAAKNEAAGMHHIEGALCGLPLLYRESGALPEYCKGFGVAFTSDNFESKLREMIDTYDRWAERIEDYPHTAERMCAQYNEMFVSLLDHRTDIVRRRWRRWLRQPLWIARTLLAMP